MFTLKPFAGLDGQVEFQIIINPTNPFVVSFEGLNVAQINKT